MSENDSSLGEQALSKAAEIGIASQLDEVQNIDVDIRTNPLKAVQGEVDSVDIDAAGMVMEKDLRVEEMHLRTGSISVNPMQAAFGKIELQRPTDASAHVVLTQQDINRAFNSDYIRDKLQDLEIQVDGHPQTVRTERVDFSLPGASKVAIAADIRFVDSQKTEQAAFTAVPQKSSDGSQIILTDVQYAEGKELSPELTQALLDKATELLDLRNFELDGMSLRLKDFSLQQGKLTIEAIAHVVEFPD